VGFDFYPNTHRIPTEKPAGIVTESPYPQIVFAYPDIRYPDIRIYPLILGSQKSGYLKVKIRLLRLFAKIV